MASMMEYSVQHSQGSLKFESEWTKAHPIVQALLNQKAVSQSEWQDLFLLVYKINSWIDDGPNMIRKTLTEDVVKYVTEAEKRIRIYEAKSTLLRVYINEWSRFYKQANILPLPFKVVEGAPSSHGKTTVASEPLIPIKQLMLDKWHTQIFSKINQELLEAAMALIEKGRNGQIIEDELVVGIRESFVELNDNQEDPLAFYRRTFEKIFIDETVSYYKSRASQYLQEHGVIDYMIYADKKLNEEQTRSMKYLDSSASSNSIVKHMERCVRVLVEEFEENILAECSGLIRKRDVEKLQRLYRLIRRTRNGIEIVLQCIDEHIRTEGLSVMRANADIITTDAEKYVAQLLAMFDRFSALVREGFCDDARLLTARDKAFRSVVNDGSIFKTELAKKGKVVSTESKCAELLANYCDLLLRKTQLSKKLTSEEIDEKLNQVLLVLKYVQNKDVFMRFHRAHLSRRLILEMSADQEKEEMMVAKLRECGMPSDMVNKLSRMLQDIEVNKDLNSNFKKLLCGVNNNKSMSDLINIKVLNAGAWGRGCSERVRVSLPREMEEFVPEIEAFYKKQHNGRKLSWMHHWSNGTLVFGTNSGGKFDLELTTFQMAVLFCWNDRAGEKISLETLKVATELPEAELFRTLISLVAYPKMKSQILLCDIAGTINTRDFTDSTLFYINQDFHLVKNGRPQYRGKVNLIGRLQLSLEPNVEKEHESIVALREFRVQEGIVKILKARKSATLAQMTTELIEILKPFFLPHRKLIKEQIDWLIENKYMERRPDDINTFTYLA